MLRVIPPEESARDGAKRLRKAAQSLARAQADILDAADTLEHFASNFEKGWLQKKPDAETTLLPFESPAGSDSITVGTST